MPIKYQDTKRRKKSDKRKEKLKRQGKFSQRGIRLKKLKTNRGIPHY